MFKRMKFRTQLFFSNGFILALMLTMSVVVYRGVTLLNESSNWVDHTYQVKENAHKLEKLVIDMDADVHAFLFVGKEELLQPFVKSQEDFEKIIVELHKLVSDNPEQTEALGRTHLAVKRWLDEFTQPVLMKRREIVAGAKDLNYLQNFVGSGVGKTLIDEIRADLGKLREATISKGDKEAENHLLVLLSDTEESESSLRGFLLSGKEDFLEPFRNTQTKMNQHIKELNEHLKDDLDSQKALQQVKALLAQWNETAATPAIAIRYEINKNKMGYSDVQEFLEQGIGQKYMGEINEFFNKFIAEEDHLLVKRSHDQETITQVVINITIFGTLLAFMFGIGIVLVLTRNIMQTVTKVLGASSELTIAIEEISRGNINLSQRTEQQAASDHFFL